MTTATAAPSTPSLRARRVAVATAALGGSALVLKVLVIVATGNGAPATVEAALYLLGVAVPLVTAGAVALLRSGWLRRLGVGLGVAIAHLVYITMLSDGVGAAVELLTDEAYLVDEVPVALLGLAWLTVAYRLRRRPGA